MAFNKKEFIIKKIVILKFITNEILIKPRKHKILGLRLEVRFWFFEFEKFYIYFLNFQFIQLHQ